MLYKGVGTTGRLTFNNLIPDGGYIGLVSSANDLFRVAGKMTVASGGTIHADQGHINMEAAIGGDWPLGVPVDNNGFFVRLTSPANTFSGNLNIGAVSS